MWDHNQIITQVHEISCCFMQHPPLLQCCPVDKRRLTTVLMMACGRRLDQQVGEARSGDSAIGRVNFFEIWPVETEAQSFQLITLRAGYAT